MLAKQEKREVYRWHFVNRLANHFSHLAFRHSCQEIGIFTKRQKPVIHLSFLVFRQLFCEIVNQSLYTSHNITDFVHHWFCDKVDKKLNECTNSSMKNLRSSELIRTFLKICNNFYRKNLRFLQESLTIFKKDRKFSYKNLKTFL